MFFPWVMTIRKSDNAETLQIVAKRLRHGLMIFMRSTLRLGNDLIDKTERFQFARSDAHAFSRFIRLGGIFPQDRRAAFGGYD